MASSQPEARVPVDLDVRVWGMGVDGRTFTQDARLHNISAGGALLSELDQILMVGDTIGVQMGPKKARCKVIWSANARSLRTGQAGVQLLTKAECPWIAHLPRRDSEPSHKVSSQRRWDRHKISLLITLHRECTSVPIRLTATDISAGGCYIETLSPFPIGFSLGVELWLAGEKVKTHAAVRTSDPRLGMGLEFVGLKEEDQRCFQQRLAAIDPFGCGSVSRPHA